MRTRVVDDRRRESEGEGETVTEQLADARPDLRAYNRSHRMRFETVVGALVEILGLKLTAYLANAKDVRSVQAWAEGHAVVRRPDQLEPRLRTALRAALLIKDADSAEIAQAWFLGLNPQLDDRSPARLLQSEPLEEVGPQVLQAARAFVVGG